MKQVLLIPTWCHLIAFCFTSVLFTCILKLFESEGLNSSTSRSCVWRGWIVLVWLLHQLYWQCVHHQRDTIVLYQWWVQPSLWWWNYRPRFCSNPVHWIWILWLVSTQKLFHSPRVFTCFAVLLCVLCDLGGGMFVYTNETAPNGTVYVNYLSCNTSTYVRDYCSGNSLAYCNSTLLRLTCFERGTQSSTWCQFNTLLLVSVLFTLFICLWLCASQNIWVLYIYSLSTFALIKMRPLFNLMLLFFSQCSRSLWWRINQTDQSRNIYYIWQLQQIRGSDLGCFGSLCQWNIPWDVQ